MTDTLLAYWFADWTEDTPLGPDDPAMARWWKKNPATDARCREQFGPAHFAAARRESPVGSADEVVASILLLDQIPRNAFRDTPHAFATDGLARQLTKRALDRSDWGEMPRIHRYFALMPLMHSESLADHDLAVEAFGELAREAEGSIRAGTYAGALEYEHKHRVIIGRFGRYPHRNAILGRVSTDEEVQFLQEPGSSF